VERVIGLGGVFFKANDPEKLKQWYREHLGMPVDEYGYVAFKTKDDPTGVITWAPFEKTTTYFAPSTAPFMINFRVRDLDKMLAQLRAAGAQVDDKIQDEPYGRFGWIIDPEGNRIELWQPID
jgi:predicted enzyme related to lactoylglutathione lyase